MSQTRLQFRLFHLNIIVALCAIVFVFIRAIHNGGISIVPVVVWISVGILAGHYAGIVLIAVVDGSPKVDRKRQLLTTIKGVVVWAGFSATIMLVMKLSTHDDQFAFRSGFGFGTPLFLCAWLLYLVFKPYWDGCSHEPHEG